MADYQLTQTGNEVQDILDSALTVTGSGVTLSQSGADVQALLNNVAGGEFVRTADMTTIPANADLNNYKEVGTYNCTRTVDAQTLSNCPVSTAFMMVVDRTLGGGNATQRLSTFRGDTYVRTWQSYNSSWEAWKRVGKQFVVRSTTNSVGKTTGSSVSISAPSVSGYTFLCWIGVATTGWVGSAYIVNMSTSSTAVYIGSSNQSSGTGTVESFALYVEN